MRIKVEELEAGPEAHALKYYKPGLSLINWRKPEYFCSAASALFYTSYLENASKSHYTQTKTVNTGGVITVSDFTVQCLSKDNDELLKQKSGEK